MTSPISCSQFKSDVVTASYKGTAYRFIFEYRDPWEWILSVIQEESLAPVTMWNAVWKFYCSGDFEERIYDEPNTADTWWNVDVSLISAAEPCCTDLFFLSLSFLTTTFSLILIFHFISGSTRVWSHGV